MTQDHAGALIGTWWIVEADLWDCDYLDLVEPAYVTFEGHGHGRFAFGCVQGSLDCEYSRRITLLCLVRDTTKWTNLGRRVGRTGR